MGLGDSKCEGEFYNNMGLGDSSVKVLILFYNNMGLGLSVKVLILFYNNMGLGDSKCEGSHPIYNNMGLGD